MHAFLSAQSTKEEGKNKKGKGVPNLLRSKVACHFALVLSCTKGMASLIEKGCPRILRISLYIRILLNPKEPCTTKKNCTTKKKSSCCVTEQIKLTPLRKKQHFNELNKFIEFYNNLVGYSSTIAEQNK